MLKIAEVTKNMTAKYSIAVGVGYNISANYRL